MWVWAFESICTQLLLDSVFILPDRPEHMPTYSFVSPYRMYMSGAKFRIR